MMSARSTFISVVLASFALAFSPAMAADSAGTLVKVPFDVDVYDQPGGEGNKRPQYLAGGSEVYFLKEEDHWCNVQGDAVPGGPGWIWCGIGDDNQDYALKPITGTDGEPPAKPDDGEPPVKPGGDDAKPADMNALLNDHNTFRAKHCVPAMTWSADLAAGAQQWASGCKMNGGKFVHSGVPGENLFWSTPPGNQGDSAVTASWYNEIGKYNFNNPGFSPDTGHFTQVVWAASTQLGCAKAVCGNFDYWVCRYSTPGNVTGQFPDNVKPLCK